MCWKEPYSHPVGPLEVERSDEKSSLSLTTSIATADCCAGATAVGPANANTDSDGAGTHPCINIWKGGAFILGGW